MIILFSILHINPSVNNKMINQTFNQISNSEFKYLPFSNHHFNHLKSAYKMFIDKPVFGVSADLFRFKCEEKNILLRGLIKEINPCSTHPHNYYFQILSENGLFYFFSFFLLLYFFYFF